MRYNLYMFRMGRRLSQAVMAKKCGCSTALYSLIERGKVPGNVKFWDNLKDVFGLDYPDIKNLQIVFEQESL